MLNAATPILIVGPSGIGKSSTCHIIKNRFPDCAFVDLDLLAGEWAHEIGIIPEPNVHKMIAHVNDRQLELGLGLQAIGAFAARNAGRRVIVDVGAGFIQGRSAEHYRQIHPVISIVADFETAYSRFVRFRSSRDKGEYLGTEFNEHRMKVYLSAHFKIDSSRQTVEQTADKLESAIKTIIRGP